MNLQRAIRIDELASIARLMEEEAAAYRAVPTHRNKARAVACDDVAKAARRMGLEVKR